MGMIFVFLVLNFVISWMNARTVGKAWSESKAVGGALRVHVVLGYILAIVGFTSVYGMLLVISLPTILPLITDIDPETMWSAVQLANDMLYILLALFIIPLGYYVWVTSFIAFWRKKSLTNGLALGWNTFANIRNTINVARHAPSAVGRIADALFKGNKRNKGAIIAVALFVIIMAVIGGWLTASAIRKKADEKYDLFEGMHCKDEPGWQPATN